MKAALLVSLLFITMTAQARPNGWHPSKRNYGPLITRMVITTYKDKTNVETVCEVTATRVKVRSTVKTVNVTASKKIINKHSKIIKDSRIQLLPQVLEKAIYEASKCKPTKVLGEGEKFVLLTKVGNFPRFPEFSIEINNRNTRTCNTASKFLIENADEFCTISE